MRDLYNFCLVNWQDRKAPDLGVRDTHARGAVREL